MGGGWAGRAEGVLDPQGGGIEEGGDSAQPCFPLDLAEPGEPSGEGPDEGGGGRTHHQCIPTTQSLSTGRDHGGWKGGGKWEGQPGQRQRSQACPTLHTLGREPSLGEPSGFHGS